MRARAAVAALVGIFVVGIFYGNKPAFAVELIAPSVLPAKPHPTLLVRFPPRIPNGTQDVQNCRATLLKLGRCAHGNRGAFNRNLMRPVSRKNMRHLRRYEGFALPMMEGWHHRQTIVCPKEAIFSLFDCGVRSADISDYEVAFYWLAVRQEKGSRARGVKAYASDFNSWPVFGKEMQPLQPVSFCHQISLLAFHEELLFSQLPVFGQFSSLFSSSFSQVVRRVSEPVGRPPQKTCYDCEPNGGADSGHTRHRLNGVMVYRDEVEKGRVFVFGSIAVLLLILGGGLMGRYLGGRSTRCRRRRPSSTDPYDSGQCKD